MTHQEKLFSVPLRYLLWLIAIVFATTAALLAIAFSSAATVIGSSPDLAISVTHSPTTGILSPGEDRWFRIVPTNGEKFQQFCLNMFYIAEEGRSRPGINFQLYSSEEVEAWRRGLRGELRNFGAGMPVSRFEDVNLGERVWRGMMMRDATYYVKIENPTELAVDYWLYDNEVLQPVFLEEVQTGAAPPAEGANTAAPLAEDPVGAETAALETAPASQPAAPENEAPAEAPADAPAPAAPVDPALGHTPSTARSLPATYSTGALAPGQEVWYSFAVDNYAEQFEPMALTMIMTPDDGHRIRNVTMEVFTKDGVRAWSRENRQALDNIGAGSVVYRDDNPWTGERVWSGWVVNNDLYYVRLTNGNASAVDYWLFNGDVYSPTLGQ